MTTEIEQLLNSNNTEDVILGILMLEESHIEEIFTEVVLSHPTFIMSNNNFIRVRTKLGGFINLGMNLVYLSPERLTSLNFITPFKDYRDETDRINEFRRRYTGLKNI